MAYKYIVVELQKNGDTVSNIVSSHDTRNDAESKYHQILASAAISAVEVHSAVMLTDEGDYVKNEHFYHEVQE